MNPRVPGPRSKPFVGNYFEFHKNPPLFLEHLAKTYGDVAHFRLGQKNIYQLNHPDFIRDVLMIHAKDFEKTGGLKRAKRVLGDGLLTSEGELHHRQRQWMQPAFRYERVGKYAAIISDFAEKFSSQFENGKPTDLAKEMLKLTLTIAGKILLNVNFDSDKTERIAKEVTVFFDHIRWLLIPGSDFLERLPLPNVRRFENSRAYLHNLIMSLIRERREDRTDEGDMLSMIMSLRDEKGEPMPDDQMRDELLTLFFAGHETTATSLMWTWYLIAQNPEAEAQFHHEVDTVLQGKLPDFEDLSKLVYTKQIFSESMRIYPPVWTLTRLALKDYQAGDYLIPAGSVVGVSQFVMHRDPRFWPDPLKFNPDRWLPEEVKKRPPFCYFPFGGGPRGCIGEHMGWMEGILILAALGRHWRFSVAPDHRHGFDAFIALRPKYGIKMIAHRRP